MSNAAVEPKPSALQRMLDGIERVGNKVPHPAIIFLGLIVLVIVLSAVLAAVGVSVTYDEVVDSTPPVVQEEGLGGTQAPDYVVSPDYDDDVEIVQKTTEVESLLSIDGIRFLFSSFVSNFAGFSVVAVIFVAMMGVGVAEESGLMAALIRKLVKVAPAGALTFIIVFIGMLSNVATDAGYLILIPLGAAAFLSVGRHPLAGLVAAFAGVSAGFAVNILITPSDALLTEVTNEAIGLVNPDLSIDITANLFFNIASTLFVTVVITFLVARVIEPRLGAYTPEPVAGAGRWRGGHGSGDSELVDPNQIVGPEDAPDVDAAAESRGLRYSLWALVAFGAGDPGRDAAVRCPAAQPRHRRHHRDVPVHGQPRLHHHADLPGLRHRVRPWGEDAHHEHRRHQRDRQDLRLAGRPDLPAAAHQPVHRVLQLLQHARRRRGRARRPARVAPTSAPSGC